MIVKPLCDSLINLRKNTRVSSIFALTNPIETHGIDLPNIAAGISRVSGLVEGDLVGAEGLEALQGTGYHRGTFLSYKGKNNFLVL